jgi:hypothetical protein
MVSYTLYVYYREHQEMGQADLSREIISTYRRHGWQLRRLLLRSQTRVEVVGEEQTFEGARIEAAPIDAMWFSRPSHGQREAWELRLLAETQYALFETFEIGDPEEAREEVRREMEARMRDYVKSDG